MAVSAEFATAMNKVDVATNKLGAGLANVSAELDQVSIRVDALKTIISTRMTDAEVAEALRVIDVGTTRIDHAVLGLDSTVVALKGIAATPVDPVPVPVPEPTPVEPPIV